MQDIVVDRGRVLEALGPGTILDNNWMAVLEAAGSGGVDTGRKLEGARWRARGRCHARAPARRPAPPDTARAPRTAHRAGSRTTQPHRTLPYPYYRTRVLVTIAILLSIIQI